MISGSLASAAITRPGCSTELPVIEVIEEVIFSLDCARL